MSQVVQLQPGLMTAPEYRRQRQEIRDTYGDSNKAAAAKRDQALAKLFAISGWTQEALAKEEGESRTHIAKKLRFGRFLQFGSMEPNFDSALVTNERSFRDLWEETAVDHRGVKEINEKARFSEICRRLTPEKDEKGKKVPAKPRPPIGDEIVKRFRDGKWHNSKTICKAILAAKVGAVDDQHVEQTLFNMERVPGRFSTRTEVKKGRRGDDKAAVLNYRMFHLANTVTVDELRTRLGPIIETLKGEGRKNTATICIPDVERSAVLLQRLLDEWSGRQA